MNLIRFQDDYLKIFTRSYLIQTANCNVFIDGGLLPGLEQKKIYLGEPERRNVLLLTHGHWDHIGCGSETLKNGGEVLVHEGDLKHVSDHGWLWEMLFGQFKEDFDLPPARHTLFWDCVGDTIEPSGFLKDGEFLQFDDLCLEVISTPGHSPGSICLFDAKTGTLFSGDSIIGNGFFGGTPQIADIDSYICSMNKLKKVHPKTVISAHNDDLDGVLFAGYLNESIESAEKAREAVAEYAEAESVLSVSGAARAIANKMGKGVGGGTCVTALAALRCLKNDSRAEEILNRYIYGY